MPIDRVLIRAPNWVGDVVLSLAAVRDVRRNFPGARIEVLARPWVAELYQAVAEVDGIRESLGLRADAAGISGAFDAAVLLPNSFASALAAWAGGIPERWGYPTDLRAPLLTRRPRVPPEVRGRSQVYYYRAMLAGVGLDVQAPPDPSLRCPEAWAARGAVLLKDDGPWLGLNPGAFFGAAKRWRPERYAAVGDAVSRRTGARVVFLGGAAERSLGEAVAAGMRSKSLVLSGETTLGDLLGVLTRLRALVTNDSGPMHLAAALGVPVVAVFGPTDWRETAPVGPRARVVREDVECAPCMLRECPVDHRCMRRISADRVTGEVLDLVGAW